MAIQPFTPPQFGTQQTEAPQVKKQRGTGFTNIGQMLQANIGAGKQMAQRVGENVGLQAGKVAEDVTKSKGAFDTKYKEAREAGEKKLGDISKVVGQVGEGGTVGAGLSGLSEEQAKEFGKQFAETKYTGPMGLEGDILKRAEGLKGLGQTLTSGQGRSQGQLIGSTLARTGPYTMGQSLLDTALIGQDIAAQNALRSAALQAMKTSGIAQSEEAVAKQQAQMAQQLLGGDKESGALRSEIQKSIAEKSGLLTEAAKKQAEEYYKKAGLFNQTLMDFVSGVKDYKEYTPEQIEALENTYGISALENLQGLTEDQQKSILNQLSQGFSKSENVSKYDIGQREALKNLALIKGDKKLAEDIAKDEQFKQAYDPQKVKEAQRSIDTYIQESRDRLDVLNKNIEISNIISSIKDIHKDKNKIDELTRKYKTGATIGGTARDYTNAQDAITDYLIKQLDPKEQQKVRQWQNAPGRTVGQLAGFLQESNKEAKQVYDRLYKADFGQDISLRNMILSQLAGVPEEKPTQKLPDRFSSLI